MAESRLRLLGKAFRDVFWGVGQPPPQSSPPDTEPRAVDYPSSFNLRSYPRGEEIHGYQALRIFAEKCTLVRLAIETRKAQISRLGWHLKSADDKAKEPAGLADVRQVLRKPDGRLRWRFWVKSLIEDILVCDQYAIYVPRNLVGANGLPARLELIDPATIMPKLDDTGRMPLGPDDVCAQQIIKGRVEKSFTRREMLYGRTNPRTHKLYGLSPVEQVELIVNLALRRDLSRLQYYTDGTVPEAICTLPKDMNKTRVSEFQTYWDSLFEGDLAMKRRMRFIPGGEGVQIFWSKEAQLKDEMDEWLARVVCYAFSLPPTWAVRIMNRAVAEEIQNASLEEGQLPLMGDVSEVINTLIQEPEYWGIEDGEHAFDDPKNADPLVQAQVQKIHVEAGIRSIDEVREQDLDMDPIGIAHMVMTSSGPMSLADFAQQPNDAESTQAGVAIEGHDGHLLPGPPGADVAATPELQQQALNGAQIDSLIEVITAVAEMRLTREAGIQLVRVSFPFIPEAMIPPLFATPPEKPEPLQLGGPGFAQDAEVDDDEPPKPNGKLNGTGRTTDA